jgi:1-acyl-sn-glycerol-3-phosphate acyltransferase
MLPCAAVSEPKAWELLYDAVAWGMWAYTRTVFRVEDVHGERFRPRPGLMLVSSHRAETDVPLLCPSLYREGRYLLDRRSARVHFAARDDMFDRGFFAGFPPALPLAARRLLYPLRAGPYLPRVRVLPVPYPTVAVLRLGSALASVPAETPLEGLLPASILDEFAARARQIGTRPPESAGETLRGSYADLLWRYCTAEQLPHPAFETTWRQRADEGARALRRIVELIRAGGVLLLFPEGRPSLDGTIGPIRKGLGTLVRRGRPQSILPIAIAYDRLTLGRARAYVAFGRTFPPPPAGLEEAVLHALRLTTPLTCGQVVAREFVAAASAEDGLVAVPALDAALAAAVEAARDEDRPIERALLAVESRRRRLTEALTWATRSGVAVAAGKGALQVSPERATAADELIARTAREYASARELAPHASL